MRLVTLVAVLALGASTASAAEPDYTLFENKIRPILVEQCQSCHSEAAAKAGKLKGNLKLDTRAGVLKGGDNGAALVPGKPGESLLLKTLKYEGDIQMPPTGKLDAKIIADFEKWIAAGAPDPRVGKEVASVGIDLAKGREFWAFRAPQMHKAPATTNAWAKTDLDKFILAKLTEKGLKPVAPADKRTLLRRVTLDLTGLPPTPDDVEAFEKDASPDAFAQVVDRLLKSKAYGERWARMWLDVARYSEDQAHNFANKPKTNAFRYRDWVIDAFNADMPYDQFAKLQIAGDLMATEGLDPTTKLAGLGFFGLGAEFYRDAGCAPKADADELDDRVDTLTRGFLGLTVACARCHDHKFDPIPQKDYYSLAGIFNGAKLTSAPLASPAIAKAYDEGQKSVKDADDKFKAALAGASKAAVAAAVPDAAKYLVAAQAILADKKKTKGLPDELAKKEKLDRYFLDRWVKALEASATAKPLAPLKDFAQLKPDLDGLTKKMADAVKAMQGGKPTPEQAVFVKAFLTDGAAPFFVPPAEAEKVQIDDAGRTKVAELRTKLDGAKKAAPPAPETASVITGPGNAMKIFIRGNPAVFGDLAPKGFLQVVGTPAPARDYTRLDLANSIAAKSNPLTARVIVNRIWQGHFGRGLVNTPSNFGKLGGPPSHPELLDTLAVGFMDNGWSLKWLHRQIALSATYQLASTNDPANAAIDGDNTYLWKAARHRLDIEQWRDGLLSVAGHLETTAGGPTYDLRDANNKRRTVYARISRHELDGLLRLFDFPDANVTADKRTTTTAPQQQLFALNSEFMAIQAKAFAVRIEKAATGDEDRVKAAYRIAYQRSPSDKELSLGVKFTSAKPNPTDKLTRWQQYAQILLASNELMYVD